MKHIRLSYELSLQSVFKVLSSKQQEWQQNVFKILLRGTSRLQRNF